MMALSSQGFLLIPGFLNREELALLRSACQPIEQEYGLRQPLQCQPAIAAALPASKLTGILHDFGMQDASIVRNLFFNKNAAHNWLVPWHQDMTICTDRKADMDGYSKWTVKQDIHHVEPPASILENMLTLRLALDDSDAKNGALKVVAGSHRYGKLSALQVQEQVSRRAPVFCEMRAGDLLLMKPLLLHASDKSIHAQQRRVLHLEYSKTSLPLPVRWAEQVGL